MALKLRFAGTGKSAFSKPTATIVLDGFASSEDGRPCVISNCVNMLEMDAQLRRIERQIADIRREASRRFVAAGVSN